MTTRQAFEAFISAPPFEMPTERFDDRGAWPGSYTELEVDLAWQAWKAATDAAQAEVDRLQAQLVRQQASYEAEIKVEIDSALEAEIRASDLAIAEYRQQCLDNAAEIERLRNADRRDLQAFGTHPAPCARHCEANAFFIKIRELEYENERLRKDAERYRWLRAQHWSDSPFAVVANPRVSVRLCATAPSHELLDAAIDAAMKGTP